MFDKLIYIFHEAVLNLKRHSEAQLISVGSAFITLLIVGIFLLVVLNANKTMNALESKVEIVVFLKDDLDEIDITSIIDKMKTMEAIESYVFVSKDAALKEFKKDKALASFFDAAESNPLPASFKLKVKPQYRDSNKLSAIASELSKVYGIEEVKYLKDEVEKILHIAQIARTGILVLTALVFISAVFIVANTTRLALYARREEIKTMKLLGATNWFIRLPFIIEGMLSGLIGGIAAIVILFIASSLGLKEINSFLGMKILVFNITIVWIILGFGTGLGILGSSLAIGRFLKA
ncbi:MAG: permease-like cell division protein FtsX [Candidatus Firestonebacteria bacterium]|mgnify:CR=1 FL=1